MDVCLRELQLTQLQILKDVDSFCQVHKIPYSLYGGTLLGAVRHGGFIPWDDDLDICMSREYYEAFLRAWEMEPLDEYILQNKENTPTFTQTFTKIRKKHSTFLQYDWERNLYHTGIFIDIFPLDRIPSEKLKGFCYRGLGNLFLLLTREFVPQETSWIQRFASRSVLTMLRGKCRNSVRLFLKKKLSQYSDRSDYMVVSTACLAGLAAPLPSDLFDSYTSILFEDGSFMCFENWEGLLNHYFRDYRKLPPESERYWKHHPIILDFYHDYEELSRQVDGGEPG